MPKINFDEIPDHGNGFRLAPEGQYLARVKNVEEKNTRNGDLMWSILLEIAKGDFSGTWVYDNLVFSHKALSRVKMVCKALGLETKGEVDLRKEAFIGRSCLIDVGIKEFNGKERNNVSFDGYHSADKPEGVPSASELYGDSTEDLPF